MRQKCTNTEAFRRDYQGLISSLQLDGLIKKGPTPIIRRERFADRRNVDRKADEVFMLSLIESFGEEPFVRGNLDAGRLSWLFGREVLPVDDPFDPCDYEARMKIDLSKTMVSFSKIFTEEYE